MLLHQRLRHIVDIKDDSSADAMSPEIASHANVVLDKIPLAEAASESESVPSRVKGQPSSKQADHQDDLTHREEIAREAGRVDGEPFEGPNPFVIGAEKLAEFWPVYVKEADAYDKELSQGWNNMLEVILIFAALFSAISTAFVLESSKDLKPDPTESTAATLLLISQTLLTISNRSAPAPFALASEPSSFVPPGSAIVVNVLWFTSLIISIFVTLIAMLAKEWSYVYMAGRTGMPMEQAHKRQKMFDGMQSWKMAGVITALPTLMHLALFLFAGGLCVRLWNIHIGVAVPVVVLTSLTALIYVAGLALPLICDYCPYATTLSKLIKPYPATWSRKREKQFEQNTSGVDGTTSRALAWMISNSEVPNSINLALQAIAGTTFNMPNQALWDCDASGAIYSRLVDLLGDPDDVTEEQLKNIEASGSSNFDSIIAYAQALNLVAVERREHANPHRGVENAVDLVYSCDGLYKSLINHESPYIKAVGYAARAACIQHKYPLDFEQYGSLLDVSELAVFAMNQQDSLRSSLSLMAISGLCAEAMHWNPASVEGTSLRTQILKNTLAIAPDINQRDLWSVEYGRAAAMVGLAMNRHALTPLGDASRRIFDAISFERNIQQHKSFILLGLSGLLPALESYCLFDSVNLAELERVFDLLGIYVFEEGALDELPLKALDQIDISELLVKSIFGCHQHLVKRNIKIQNLDDVLGRLLRRVFEPWVTPIVLSLLKGPAEDGLRRHCVRCVAQNQPAMAGMGAIVLCDALYEATRLNSARRNRIPQNDIIRLTEHFEQLSVDDEQGVYATIHALLQQLLHSNMLSSLLILLGEIQSTSTLNYWQRKKAAYVARFWGETIVQWGRKIMQEGRSNNDTDMMKEIFEGDVELKDWHGDVVVGAMKMRSQIWQRINNPVLLTGRMFHIARLSQWKKQRDPAPTPTIAEP